MMQSHNVPADHIKITQDLLPLFGLGCRLELQSHIAASSLEELIKKQNTNLSIYDSIDLNTHQTYL